MTHTEEEEKALIEMINNTLDPNWVSLEDSLPENHCQHPEGHEMFIQCKKCSLSNYGRDCKNQKI
jgi:hypothetical protein